MQTEVSNGIEELLALLDSPTALRRAPAMERAGESGAVLMLAGSSEVRMDKVKAIRAALMAGDYYVPARMVAAKMLEAMLTIEGERALRDRRKKPRVGHRTLIRARRSTSVQ